MTTSYSFPPEYYRFERAGEHLFFDPRNFVWFRTDELGRTAVEALAKGGHEAAARAVAERTGHRPEEAGGYIDRWTDRLLEIGFLHAGDYERRMPVEMLAPHPVDLYLHVTSRCNLRCIYCYNLDHRDAIRKVDPGSFQQLRALVEEAADIGFESLRITGGEALLNPGTLPLARRGMELGLMVNLLTNGILIDRRRAEEIADVVDVVSISLDSAHPEEHDLMRGRGSHGKVVASIRRLKEAGLRFLHLNAVVTPVNKDTVRDFLAYAWDELGADQVTLAPSEVALPDPRGIRTGKGYVLGKDDLLDIQEVEQEFYRERGAQPDGKRSQLWRCQCGAANGVVSVDANGDVYPCQTMHAHELRCGNAFEQGLAAVLETSRMLQRVKKLTVEAIDGCDRCPVRYICGGGCRFQSYCGEGRIDCREAGACKVHFRRALDALWNAARFPSSETAATRPTQSREQPSAPPC